MRIWVLCVLFCRVLATLVPFEFMIAISIHCLSTLIHQGNAYSPIDLRDVSVGHFPFLRGPIPSHPSPLHQCYNTTKHSQSPSMSYLMPHAPYPITHLTNSNTLKAMSSRYPTAPSNHLHPAKKNRLACSRVQIQGLEKGRPRLGWKCDIALLRSYSVCAMRYDAMRYDMMP